MNMKAILLCLMLGWTGAAGAETLDCPDLAGAVQVGACPTEEELRYTFQGYCSDNARLYDRGDQVCTDYALYRALKNVSLWETPDGRFAGYVSCETGRAGLAGARARQVGVARQGSVTRVACSYDSGVVFAHRTKARCVAAAGDCAADAAACRAQCE